MSKAPGYEKWPNHRILETRLTQQMAVRIGETIFANSRDVIRVDEDGHPVRFYFPRASVRMDLLDRSETTTHCPFKGTATYFSARVGDQTVKDAVWSYEQPFDEHVTLKDLVAFYEEKVPGLQIEGR